MKKTKLLIPVLTIAGLGAAIAPMVAMTSCTTKSDVPVTEEEFKNQVKEIQTTLNKDQNIFEPSEITFKKDNVTQKINAVFQSEEDSNRYVKVAYPNSDTSSPDKQFDISSTYYLEEMDKKIGSEDLESKTYYNYDNYVKAVIVIGGSKGGTFEYQIYKNGFLKYYKEALKGTSEETFEMAYSVQPHEVKEFKLEFKSTLYYQEYIKQNTEYKVTFKTPTGAPVNRFYVANSNSGVHEELTGCSIKDEKGVDVQYWTYDSTNKEYKAPNPLGFGQTYTITFTTTASAGYHYLSLDYNS